MKFAGFTKKQLQKAILDSRERNKYLDPILGRKGASADVVEELLQQLPVASSSTSSTTSTSRKRVNASKKGKVLKFPFGSR